MARGFQDIQQFLAKSCYNLLLYALVIYYCLPEPSPNGTFLKMDGVPISEVGASHPLALCRRRRTQTLSVLP